ncbi:hypothetical protein BRD18_07260 [Halobacteriales archaeon SW_7_71_33]|nr:MAG: hypothetical protein BRD18_07260 [Halobacteriales archaeon SW_7_71_33]
MYVTTPIRSSTRSSPAGDRQRRLDDGGVLAGPAQRHRPVVDAGLVDGGRRRNGVDRLEFRPLRERRQGVGVVRGERARERRVDGGAAGEIPRAADPEGGDARDRQHGEQQHDAVGEASGDQWAGDHEQCRGRETAKRGAVAVGGVHRSGVAAATA